MKKLIQANILNVVTALFALSLLSVFYFSSYSPTKAEQSSIIGEQKTLVALFNYADDQSEAVYYGVTVSLDTIKNHVMYDTQSVNNFVKENSYNKAWLNPTFIDWHTLPSSSTEFGDTAVDQANNLLPAAIKALDDEVYFPDYKRLIFIFKGNSNIKFAGFGFNSVVQQGLYNLSPDGDIDASAVVINSETEIGWPLHDIMAHELGHGFGFMHAASFKENNDTNIPPDLNFKSGTYFYNSYGDDDNMGGGDSQWSTFWKEEAGWLDPSQIKVATQSVEYELDQIELPSSGVKMLKIPLGKDIGGEELYYFLEYRKPLGLFDTADVIQVRLKSPTIFGSILSGVNTVRFSSGDLGGPFIDANIDQPFFDPYRGIKIELLEKTGEDADSKARVRVTFSGVDLSPTNLMKYVESDYDQNPQILTVSNNTTSPLDIGQVTIAGKDSSSYNIVEDNASNKTIAAGDSVTIKVRFSPTTSSDKFAYLSVPTNNDLRPTATVSLYGRDNDGPGWWPNKPVSLSAPIFSTNVSNTNSFNLSWLATDSFSTIAGYQLQYHPHTTTTWRTFKIDGQYWTPKTKTTFTGKPGYTYYFRVRAKDQAGNIGNFSDIHSTIVPFDNVSLNYSYNWKSANPSSSFRRTTNYTYTKGAFASLAFFTGGSLTLIAPKGPNRGKMDVYIRDKVNGVWTSYKKVKTIDQYSSTYKSRVPINLKPWDWDSTWYVPRSHQIKFVATGKKNTRSTGTRVVIDGLAVEKNPYDGY